ncbi:hypothetical protein [Salirhabdus salicampi]|uniref:hypothetical protein n=1 Tax=Salirhabdus salicampi TaxID=476102 RepID=UPI0020C390A8|nr:hypothetical protein [Salirhabdus salicampi]MCP8617478.1 hypothetical protein [Salirhabdus salicampi]
MQQTFQESMSEWTKKLNLEKQALENQIKEREKAVELAKTKLEIAQAALNKIDKQDHANFRDLHVKPYKEEYDQAMKELTRVKDSHKTKIHYLNVLIQEANTYTS